MDFTPAIVSLALVAFALVSRRLGRSAVTGTMIFAALGLALGPEMLGLIDLDGLLGEWDVVSLVLTATLVVVLFTDASAINSSNWRDDIIPARLLGIGLPMMIALGWLLALVILDDLDIWEAAILATILAPTDAALGKAVVSNPRVPQRIRQALNIESGLNDGIALPVFVVFLETALVAEKSLAASDIATELGQQVGIAVAVGVAVGWVGAWAIAAARRADLAFAYWLQIGVLALAVTAYTLADPLGGSGFIAAWVAGFVFGHRFDSAAATSLPDFAESTGDLLTIASFFLFGLFLGPVLADLRWEIVLYAVLSLTVVRLVAVATSMIGAGLRPRSVLYMGWFGPRGLATIILTIEIIGEGELLGSVTIADTALFAVGLSVVLHGATAWFGSNTYADYVERHPRGDEMAERIETATDVRVPMRSRHITLTSSEGA